MAEDDLEACLGAAAGIRDLGAQLLAEVPTCRERTAAMTYLSKAADCLERVK